MNPRNIKWYVCRARRSIRQRIRGNTFLILCTIALLLYMGHKAGYIAGSY